MKMRPSISIPLQSLTPAVPEANSQNTGRQLMSRYRIAPTSLALDQAHEQAKHAPPPPGAHERTANSKKKSPNKERFVIARLLCLARSRTRDAYPTSSDRHTVV